MLSVITQARQFCKLKKFLISFFLFRTHFKSAAASEFLSRAKNREIPQFRPFLIVFGKVQFSGLRCDFDAFLLLLK